MGFRAAAAERHTDTEMRIETNKENNKGETSVLKKKKGGRMKNGEKVTAEQETREMGKENLWCVVAVVSRPCGFHTGRGRVLC